MTPHGSVGGAREGTIVPHAGRLGNGRAWRWRRAAWCAIAFISLAVPARAQVSGYVSVMADALPDTSTQPGSQSVSELRTRVFVEHRRDIGEHVRLNLSGYVDALVANRSPVTGSVRVRDAIVRPADMYVDIVTDRFDLRVGASRIAWGRLDEFQPTDVVNPIDLTRFLLEGRSEARLAVGMVRGRWFLPRGAVVEALVVPAFRSSRFDQVDEPTSPFYLSAPVVDRREPRVSPGHVQGGARLTATSGRTDWSISAYRGFRTFPTLTVVPPFSFTETFPRFTMVGGDFETVRGPWGVRGEVAAFVRDELQSIQPVRGVHGRSIEAGIGVDREAGNYRVAGNLLWSHRAANDDADSLALREEGSDVSVVASATRSFARETRTLRLFAVYDPVDRTTFARAIAAVSVRDNVWIEGSGGLFAGSSGDVLGRLRQRDFLYLRLKVYF